MERDDELMAVLLGEPPDTRDGASAARHAAAERDMDAVREQLRWIGDGLAREAAGREAAGPAGPVRRRRVRGWGLFALAASVVLALLGTGTMYVVAHGGVGEGGADALLTEEGLVACARAVVEGTVERVESAGGDRYRIVLEVERYYKPSSGDRRLSFSDQGEYVPAYYRTGARMLVLVSSLSGEGPVTYRAGDEPYAEGGKGAAGDDLEAGRLMVEEALPGARDVDCSAG
ncbi:hypothetical protein [Streptomyces sp. S.PB5]|uniref:hypothetical protein n=1 Tax=Streptomyces sp. S.PB5 TaxID=3020844 RepID=UPI0025B023E5|nr:hypothetical protein [Streptomyces sp. S.PB5]MDN3022862.1 hypothetical protein [Streptomyces sp. S.PB5]